MGRGVFKYLIPLYIAWFIIHIIFFFRFVLSQAGKTTPDFSGFGPLLLSHVLIILLGIAFFIYMLIDAILRKYRNNSQKVVWIVVIVVLNLLGAIVYYYVEGKNPRK
jgi:hypothetical protein